MRLFLAAILAATAYSQPAPIYIPGSSVKLYQVNGDCDWVVWDSTITNKTPTCKPTTSQTAIKADVLGNDVPVAFEHNVELIVTFGDTIGGVKATVQFAGLVAPGEYQFNVVVPSTLTNGDQSIIATINGQSTQTGTSITIHN